MSGCGSRPSPPLPWPPVHSIGTRGVAPSPRLTASPGAKRQHVHIPPQARRVAGQGVAIRRRPGAVADREIGGMPACPAGRAGAREGDPSGRRPRKGCSPAMRRPRIGPPAGSVRQITPPRRNDRVGGALAQSWSPPMSMIVPHAARDRARLDVLGGQRGPGSARRATCSRWSLLRSRGPVARLRRFRRSRRHRRPRSRPPRSGTIRSPALTRLSARLSITPFGRARDDLGIDLPGGAIMRARGGHEGARAQRRAGDHRAARRRGDGHDVGPRPPPR